MRPVFQRGDRVRLNGIEARVGLASANGDSLFLFFDWALRTKSGGMLVGSAAVLRQDDGSWIEIVEQTPVTIEAAE